MTIQVLDFNNFTRTFFWLLFSLVILLAGVYFWITFSLTSDMVERGKMIQKVYELQTKVGKIEVEYMRMQNSVTLGYAKNLGFVEVEPKFAGAPSKKFSLARP